MNCGSCQFAHVSPKANSNVSELFCRKRAPQVIPVIGEVSKEPSTVVSMRPPERSISTVGFNTVFPRVEPDWWCGEYKATVAVLPKPSQTMLDQLAFIEESRETVREVTGIAQLRKPGQPGPIDDPPFVA